MRAAPPLVEPDVQISRIRLSWRLSPGAFTGKGFLFGLVAQLLSQLKEFGRQRCLVPGLRLGSHPLRFFRPGVFFWITQSVLSSSDSALSPLRPLGSTVVTRFSATMGRSDSRACFRSVIDCLAESTPSTLPPVTGLPGSWIDPWRSRCPLRPREVPDLLLFIGFGQDVGFAIYDKLATSIFRVTRLISVRFRYSSTLASRSSNVSVAAAVVQVASC